jgi:hypothetical protein
LKTFDSQKKIPNQIKLVVKTKKKNPKILTLSRFSFKCQCDSTENGKIKLNQTKKF